MHMSQEPQPFDRADCVVSGYPHKPVALGHLTGTELPTRFTHKLPEVEGDGWTPGGLALLIAAAELHHVLHNQIPPGSVPPAGQS